MKKTHITKTLVTGMLCVAALCGCSSGNSFKLKPVNEPLSNAKVEKQVNELYDRMTQGERVAQLCGLYAHDLYTDGKLDPEKCKKAMPYGIGHFSQYASNGMYTPDSLRDMVAELQNWIKENTPNGVPALFHEEVLSGVATFGAATYPQQIGMACSFNPELARIKTVQTAKTARQVGGYLALSPMLDVVRNPHFNRLEESYGEDAYLAAAMGLAFVQGLQEGGFENGIAATTKHFLGYGGGGDAGEKELMEEILLPHETAIRLGGSKVVMTGYHSVHGVPAVASDELQHGILRDYLGFDGLMVSDYSSVNQIRTEPDPMHKAVASINSGNHVDFPTGDNFKYMQQALDEGLVSEEVFEEAVKRVLTVKARLGMLDDNAKLYAEGHIEFDSPEERQTAYEMATQSVVLLKNDGILPLKEPQKIALTGPNANSMWAMMGDYTYKAMLYFWRRRLPDNTNPHVVGLKEGLEAKMPAGFSIAYERGCDWTEQDETTITAGGDSRANALRRMRRRVDSGEPMDLGRALQQAAESDVIVAAVGENLFLCGENRDRETMRLPGAQEQFVEQLIATGKPVVLVIFGGRAQVISGLAEKCAAVIQAWYPGEEGGNALADILYGNVSPSGKLCVSYPNVELNEPICYDYSAEADPRVAWPFGYGLSYTSFEYSNLVMDNSVKTSSEKISVAFDVQNTGDCAADEIVQLYVSPTSAEQD
ncbi:MAG: glycoside hydrolase family 3 N-terminal domain-containing protein, partial [Bacteroidia bacterium]|nr:glycoside hydrolase family 3 N-terminal domain-containing protein [Bacteroidia bacterium]